MLGIAPRGQKTVKQNGFEVKLYSAGQLVSTHFSAKEPVTEANGKVTFTDSTTGKVVSVVGMSVITTPHMITTTTGGGGCMQR